ncbi:MAG: thiazole synthase [Alphaproteobacteria bacterium]
MSDIFEIGDLKLNSRLLVGTAMFPNQQTMVDAIQASGSEFVTVSIRRISMEQYNESPIDLLKGYNILPNTAGCETPKDVILTANLARESLETNWIKLELIADRQTLYPDVENIVDVAEELVKDGFNVLPYCTDDPIICKKLADVGCKAVMPLGAPIGTGLGICNPYNIELICKNSSVPVILDAGIGTPSDATRAMELGCSAVLLNTAISKSEDPVLMASAFKDAVSAGRKGYLSGRMAKKFHAEASSPQMGLIGG